jgi:hypothetical protein
MFSPKKWILLCLVLTAVIFSVASTASASLTEPFEIRVTISGLGMSDLTAFDLNLNYNINLLTYESYELTDALGSIDLFDADDWSAGDDGSGSVNLSVVSYLDDFSAQPEAFTLAAVSFTGDETGLAGISLSDILLFDELNNALPFTVDGTHINVVPLPGAVWLMGSALVAVAGLRRRFRR